MTKTWQTNLYSPQMVMHEQNNFKISQKSQRIWMTKFNYTELLRMIINKIINKQSKLMHIHNQEHKIMHNTYKSTDEYALTRVTLISIVHVHCKKKNMRSDPIHTYS